MTESIESLSKRVDKLEKCIAVYESFFVGLSKLLNDEGDLIPPSLKVLPAVAVVPDAAAGDTIPSAPPTPTPAPSAPSDADLDGPYGDPKVFRDPPDWEGESYAGKKFSECPAKYLLETAKFLDWAAADDKKKNVLASNNKPRHVYRELDAKRARGWAARMAGSTNASPAAPKNGKIDPNDSDYTFDDA